jgi:hypothetical protein
VKTVATAVRIGAICVRTGVTHSAMADGSIVSKIAGTAVRTGGIDAKIDETAAKTVAIVVANDVYALPAWSPQGGSCSSAFAHRFGRPP